MPLAPYLPLGTIVRLGAFARESDSIAVALPKLEDSGGWLPVVDDDGILVGVLRESSVRHGMARDIDWSGPVRELVDERVPSLLASATAAEAFRLMQATNEDRVAVVEFGGVLAGVIRAVDLAKPEPPPAKPSLIGGMATPFGVYLTGGGVHAGAPVWALSVTGALMVGSLVAVSHLADAIGFQLFKAGLPISAASQISNLLSVFLFFVTLRLLPLSGTHAAEHQVVHAIERGEPLEPAVVRRMPRVHPRCGTNLGVAAMLFLWLGTSPVIRDAELRLIFAAGTTLIFWRPLGAFMQLAFTTRPANDAQIRNGIAAGRELLERYAKHGYRVLPFGHRIWLSGLIQVMLGGWLMAGGLYLVGRAIGVPIVQ